MVHIKKGQLQQQSVGCKPIRAVGASNGAVLCRGLHPRCGVALELDRVLSLPYCPHLQETERILLYDPRRYGQGMKRQVMSEFGAELCS